MDIFELIKTGELDEVVGLLNEYPALLYQTDENGLHPVMVALYYGKRDLADDLRSRMEAVTIFEAAALGDLASLQAEAGSGNLSLDAVSSDGFTPLGLAAFFGRVDVLAWLLEQGADPNKPSQNKMAVFPINSAAAHQGNAAALSMVRLLIDHGANVNAAQHGGWTPLHQAASHGFEQMVRLLLDSGADPSVKSEDGRTAAEMAAENGFHLLVERLKNH